jgi:hypothetical protein
MGLQDNAGQTDRDFIQNEYAKDSSKGKESSDSFSIYKLKGGLTQARVLPPYVLSVMKVGDYSILRMRIMLKRLKSLGRASSTS